MTDIPHNLQSVQKKIKKACDHWQVDDTAIQLIAVSKKQPDEKIDAMLAAGHHIYGENRVQEAQLRWAGRKDKNPQVQLHLIGPLQTNKVKEAVSLFDVIHTVDRPKLVKALVKEMSAQNKTLACFIQVNTGEEPQKSGVLPEDCPALFHTCREAGLKISGLMCIPPFDEPPAHHFALLRQMAEELGLKDLSMGMSSDYEKAIPLTMAQGRTFIRVGTALFGARES